MSAISITCSVNQKLARIFRSNRFFYLVIGLIVLQGLWFTMTYEPGLFDEKFHFDFINMYTETWNPFLSDQDTKWDKLGETTRNTSYLYYYLMSFPLRLVKLFTDSYFAQVLGLRIISLAFFVGGAILFNKLLRRLSGSNALANITLLIVTILPVYATLVSAINYDALTFLLVPAALLVLFDIVQSRKTEVEKTFILLTLVLLSCLIKYSLIPFLAAIIIILAIHYWRLFNKNAPQRIIGSIRRLPLAKRVILILMFLFALILFAERPVLNTIAYGRPTISCTKILSKERCLRNYTAARSINFRGSRPVGFIPSDPVEYLLTTWSIGILRTQVRILPSASIYYLQKLIYFGASVTGVFIIFLFLGKLYKDKNNQALMIIIGVYVIALFLENYGSYVRNGRPVAISARYLLPIAPLIIYLALIATKYMMAKLKLKCASALLVAAFIALMITQGGSIFTHLTTVNAYKWPNNTAIHKINSFMDKVSSKLIIKRPPLN